MDHIICQLQLIVSGLLECPSEMWWEVGFSSAGKSTDQLVMSARVRGSEKAPGSLAIWSPAQ